MHSFDLPPFNLEQAFEISTTVLVMMALFWLYRSAQMPRSRFKLREADRKRLRATEDLLAHAKYTRPSPLLLTGICIEGAAHDVLGIRSDASPAEIQAAHRSLMKQYHPDRVGRPGSREWNDAQAIASALHKARDEMLKRCS